MTVENNLTIPLRSANRRTSLCGIFHLCHSLEHTSASPYSAGSPKRAIGLDIDLPDPPRLGGAGDPGDYEAVEEPATRTGNEVARADIADMLDGGAWEDAFYEWSETTGLNDEDVRVVVEAGLFQAFDFYWNPSAEDVGYRSPSVSEERLSADVPSSGIDAREVESELDDLGRTVSEVLENDYIHRDAWEFGYDFE